MNYVMVDVETDGPIPGDYSMIALAAVVVRKQLDVRFSVLIQPISESFVPEALTISGFTRPETLRPPFVPAPDAIASFDEWLRANVGENLRFVSDNNGFDWMFVAWYFHHFLGSNPFGYSSTNLGSLYNGAARDMTKSFKHLRQTEHTHEPLDDAVGNAEAMLTVFEEYRIAPSIGADENE